MPDPLYSDRATQLFVLTPGPGHLVGTPNGSDGQPIRYCSGFMTDVDGTMTVVGKDGGSAVTLTVKGGVKYDIGLKQLLSVTTITQVVGYL